MAEPRSQTMVVSECMVQTGVLVRTLLSVCNKTVGEITEPNL